MALNTTALIATHIVNTMSVSAAVSGTMIDLVEVAKNDVEQYTGQTISSNSIGTQYQSPIILFAKADALDHIQADGTSATQSIEGLSIGDSNLNEIANNFRKQAQDKLKYIGRNVQVERVLS